MDADTTITRVMDGPADEYIALVRRVTMPSTGVRTRWDGFLADGLPKSDAPSTLASNGVPGRPITFRSQ